MKCPDCEKELSKDNFEVEVYNDRAEVVMLCECGHEDIPVAFGQDDLA